ncbi:hypothetical protein K2Y11_21315 [bacterium]|nr:hypothetical protein [bacterium]
MATRKNSTPKQRTPRKQRPTCFADVFPIAMFQKIGFPIAFPVMPLGAFCWASAPGKYDPSARYEVDGGVITQIQPNGVRFEFAVLGEDMAHHEFSIEANSGESIKGVFVGSKLAINNLKTAQAAIDVVASEAVSTVLPKSKLVQFS